MDGGATWTAAQRLTVNPGMSVFVSMACETSSALHLAWEDITPGNSELFYIKSTDGGASWTPEKRLTWNSGRSTRPVLVVDPAATPTLSGGIIPQEIMRSIIGRARIREMPGTLTKG